MDKKAAEANNNTMQLCLHDCVALGQVEQGLLETSDRSNEEFARLPTLLRLLSACRQSSLEDKEYDLTESILQRLEDRATLYSSAESVEVVACHLAPAVCKRKMIKLKQLLKEKKPLTTTITPTSTTSSSSKRRKLEADTTSTSSSINKNNDARKDDDVLMPSVLDDDDDDGGDDDPKNVDMTTDRSGSLAKNNSKLAVQQDDDSTESTALKVLDELVFLVQTDLTEKSSSILDDFALAQEMRQPAAGQSDLGAILVSLMHYAPVLRHRRVASAICRANLPQASALVGRMGANVPAAVPCLVRGALDAYTFAASSRHANHLQYRPIANAARKAVRALAKLSPRESSRILTMLQQENVMIDVQLGLAIELDGLEALSLIRRELGRTSADQEVTVTPLATRRVGLITEQKPKIVLRTLSQHLSENHDLLATTLRFLASECRLLAPTFSWSRSIFVLSACTQVFCQIPMLDSLGRSKKCFSAFSSLVEALADVEKGFSNAVPSMEVLNNSSKTDMSVDRAIGLLFCGLFSGLLVSSNLSDAENLGSQTLQAAQRLHKALLRLQNVPGQALCVMVTISLSLQHRDRTVLCNELERMLAVRNLSRSKCFAELFEKACKFYTEKSEPAPFSWQMVSERDNLLANLSPVTFLLKSNVLAIDEKKKLADKVLSVILVDATSALDFLRSENSIPALKYCLNSLFEEDRGTHLPFVMPLKLEGLALKCDTFFRLEASFAHFLLNFLYCMEFLCATPDSPFCINPRIFPLKEILLMCENESPNVIHPALSKRLRVLLAKHTPEITFRKEAWRILTRSRHVTIAKSVKSMRKVKEDLRIRMRESLLAPESDPSGSRVESAYLQAAGLLCDVDLFTTTVSTITSTVDKRNIFITLPMLHRDPMALLKCPCNVFERRGWRRVLLHVLQSMLETNESISSSCPDQQSLLEFLFARDQIMVRCLVSILSTPPGPMQHCSMTEGLVRRTIAKGQGIVAFLLKQQADSNDLFDWLVEKSPELIEDRSSLLQLLTDRHPMTSLERLCVADRVIRIVVFHGQRYEADVVALAVSALSRFLSAFFLVIGPVGVPVNSLVGEGTGTDVTKSARLAAYRILKALVCVRGYRKRLRSECGMCLQKLVGLCKGENIVSGLSGPVAQRQKAFLKEFLDAVYRAADTIGPPQM